MQPVTQAKPPAVQPAPTTTPVAAQCNYADPNLKAVCEIAVRAEGKADWSVQQHQVLAGDVATLQRDVRSLKGRITPQPSGTTSAPTKTSSPKGTQPTATSSAQERCGKECLRVVKFAGSEADLADIDLIKNLVSGRYEIADQVWLPVPGANDREKGLRRVARVNSLGAAYGSALVGRQPSDSEELAELMEGARRFPDAGAVFHLRLKSATVATAPTTP